MVSFSEIDDFQRQINKLDYLNVSIVHNYFRYNREFKAQIDSHQISK